MIGGTLFCALASLGRTALRLGSCPFFIESLSMTFLAGSASAASSGGMMESAPPGLQLATDLQGQHLAASVATPRVHVDQGVLNGVGLDH